MLASGSSKEISGCTNLRFLWLDRWLIVLSVRYLLFWRCITVQDVSVMLINASTNRFLPVPVAVRSKVYVCGRSPAEIVGSNPAGGMDVCCECCVLSGRGLCDELVTRPEESYRKRCVVVWPKNLKNEETMARVGPQRHGKKKQVLGLLCTIKLGIYCTRQQTVKNSSHKKSLGRIPIWFLRI
jgi:hypothetical protein